MSEDRIVRDKELTKLTGLSRATIWRKEKDNTFPKRCRISKRAVGWRLSAVYRWIEEQKAQENTDDLL